MTTDPPEMPVDEEGKIHRYNDKIKTIFRETCINKALVHDQRARELPRYIFEWLISKYQSDGELTPENKREMYRLIEEHYPDPENIELYKYKILMENETLHILNPYKVSVDTRSEKFVIYFPFFSGETRNVGMVESIVTENKALLTSGLWGIASITKGTSTKAPFYINSFSPVQIEEVHLDQFIASRSQFTIAEWVDLLINTIGLNPATFPTVNEKMLLLARLLPYVEPNYNLVEMGPKGTGKSFIHKNTSTHSHVIGGGTISRAQLFYNLGKQSRGILLTNDVVVFDDFSNLRIEQANEVIGKLKNFMNDGIIDVGRFRENCSASVVIMGNVDIDHRGLPANSFYFRNLPREMQESAFLDRIAGFIPGWQLHPITKRDLSMNYGLIGDWFSELLHSLRKSSSFLPLVESKIDFKGEGCRLRDVNNMRLTVSGLVKLLFPDRIMADEDWHFVAKVAVGLRQGVVEQLARIDPEYRGIHLSYGLRD